MLSYQHAYHAGSRVDIHKHDLLSRALETLRAHIEPVTYIETHAGRGLYDLRSKETLKTGEAGEGWMKLVENKSLLKKLSPSYVDSVRALNKGKLSPLYPGSPAVAKHILRKQDSLELMELHPAEFGELRKNLGKDTRIKIHKRDGLEGAMNVRIKGQGLLLIDPSYEVKAEYETIPDFVREFHRKWPEAAVLIWVPMLPAMRHEGMVEKLQKGLKDLQISAVEWSKPGEVRGMYGSIMMGINAASAFQTSFAPYIREL